MPYHLDNDEIEIDLIDLLRRALRQWKLGIALVLVCALAGGGFAWLKSSRSQDAEVYDETALASARDVLTERELAEADRVYDQYRAYFRVLEAQRNRVERSPVMALDPAAAVIKSRQFLVTSRQTGLVPTIGGRLMTAELYQQLADAAGYPDSADYMEDLVSISYTSWQNWQDIAVDGEKPAAAIPSWNASPSETQGEEGNGVSLEDSRGVSVVTLTVTGGDEAFCDKLLVTLQPAFDRVIADLAVWDPTITASRYDETVVRDNERTLSERQRDMIATLTTMATERGKFVTDVMDKLNERQRGYISQLKLRDGLGETEAPKSRGIGRMAAVGFLGGAVLFFLWIFLPYVFGGRVRTARELEATRGIRMLQQILPGERTPEEAARMAARELGAWKPKRAAESMRYFFVPEEAAFPEDGPFWKTLSADAGDFAIQRGDPLADEEALSAMLKSSGIVLGIGVDVSKRERLARICRIAADHDVPILGYVAA